MQPPNDALAQATPCGLEQPGAPAREEGAAAGAAGGAESDGGDPTGAGSPPRLPRRPQLPTPQPPPATQPPTQPPTPRTLACLAFQCRGLEIAGAVHSGPHCTAVPTAAAAPPRLLRLLCVYRRGRSWCTAPTWRSSVACWRGCASWQTSLQTRGAWCSRCGCSLARRGTSLLRGLLHQQSLRLACLWALAAVGPLLTQAYPPPHPTPPTPHPHTNTNTPTLKPIPHPPTGLLPQGLFHQALLGDLNTMAHGIARLSPNYCRDHMRYRRAGRGQEGGPTCATGERVGGRRGGPHALQASG